MEGHIDDTPSLHKVGRSFGTNSVKVNSEFLAKKALATSGKQTLILVTLDKEREFAVCML
jgi:hypothetical protein